VHIYVNGNGKLITVETVPGMGEKGIKENGDGVNSNMIHLVYRKNFCKCHSLFPPRTPITKE
jgi:hypothetical protein